MAVGKCRLRGAKRGKARESRANDDETQAHAFVRCATLPGS